MKRWQNAWNRMRAIRKSRMKSSASHRRRRDQSLWSFSALEARLLLAGEISDSSAIADTVPTSDLACGDVSRQGDTVRATPSAIVFIDSRVNDIQTLQSGLIEGAELVLIDSHRDALEQISLHLQRRQDVASLHLVSHGASGQLLLGNQSIDHAVLAARASDIQHWSLAMTNDADILVYGCDAGSGDTGTNFAIRLAKITGADVAMSTDKTGSAKVFHSSQPDWDLERHIGSIESPLAFNQETQRRYTNTLDANTLGLPLVDREDTPVFVPVIDETIVVESTDSMTTIGLAASIETTELDHAIIASVVAPVADEASDNPTDLDLVLEPVTVRERSLDSGVATEPLPVVELSEPVALLDPGMTLDAGAVEVEPKLAVASEAVPETATSVQTTEQILAFSKPLPLTVVAPVPNPPIPASDRIVTLLVLPSVRRTPVESSPLNDLSRSSSALSNSSRNQRVVPTIHASATEATPSRVLSRSKLRGSAESEGATANVAKTGNMLTPASPTAKAEVLSNKTIIKTSLSKMTPLTTNASGDLQPSQDASVQPLRHRVRSVSNAVDFDAADETLEADVTVEQMDDSEATAGAATTPETGRDSMDQSQPVVFGGSWAAWAYGSLQNHSVSSAASLEQTEIDRTSFTTESLSWTSASYRYATRATDASTVSPTPNHGGEDDQGLHIDFGNESSTQTSAENVNLNSVNTLQEGVSLATIGHTNDYGSEVRQAGSDQLVFKNTADSSVRWLDAVTELHQLAWKPETAGSDGAQYTLAYLNPISRYAGD